MTGAVNGQWTTKEKSMFNDMYFETVVPISNDNDSNNTKIDLL